MSILQRLSAWVHSWHAPTNAVWLGFGFPYHPNAVSSANGIGHDSIREDAIDVLERHGIKAHLYFPAAGIEDSDLKDALRCLHERGYIFSSKDGALFGGIAQARPAPEERAQIRRRQMKVVR